MTGPRKFGRASRSRVFIGLGAFVLTVTVVFVKLQLDESRKMEERCVYQQHTLNLQLTDLQKKLKVERSQYEQIKYNMEQQSQKKYELKERTVQESNTKLTSLQQHYKLLKNQYDDFKEECTKDKSGKIDKIKGLQNKLDSYEKENSCKEWKTKYFELLNAKHMESINNFDHDWRSSSRSTKEAVVEKNFIAQIAVNDKLYSIPIKYNNNNIDKNVKNTTSEYSVDDSIALFKTTSFKSKPIQNDQQMKFPNGVVPIPFEPNIEQAIHSSEKVQVVQKNAQNEDMGAREENDSNYEEQNNHMPKALSHTNDLIGEDNNKPNNFDAIDIPNVNDDDLQVIQQPNDVLGKENKLRNKMKNEVNEDQGKAYLDEMNFQVEDEDDDEYIHEHRHHQQGEAVRERR